MGQSVELGPNPGDLLRDPKLFQPTWPLRHAHTTTGSVPGFAPKDGAYYFSPVCHHVLLNSYSSPHLSPGEMKC